MLRPFQISTLAPLAGRDIIDLILLIRRKISILAPLAGRDEAKTELAKHYCISILAPLAGSDIFFFPTLLRKIRFQSSLPSQGAT